MWKTPDRFWAEIGPYDHILALKKGQIHCAAVDLALFRKPQLGLFALAFGGLQVWWIGSVFKKQRAPRPMGEGEFRKALERIWAKKT